MNTTKRFSRLQALTAGMTAAAGRTALVLTLIIGLSACSGSEDAIEQTTPGSPATAKTYTLTVTATKSPDDNALARAIAEANGGGATRALGYDEGTKTINAAWAVGDKVQVANENIQRTAVLGGYLEAKGNGDEVSLTGDLTGRVMINDPLLLAYPQLNCDYTGQDGTLDKIASTYDYAYGYAIVTNVSSDGKITAENDGNNGGPVQFDNLQAIVRFKLLNKADNSPINATIVTIDAKNSSSQSMLIQTYDYQTKVPTYGPITINASPGSNVIFAALCPDEPIGSYDYTITATDGTSSYSCTQTGVTLKYGKYYEITLKMTEQLFTVNDYSKKVRFARGNLQYKKGTGWRFAEHQWDRNGEYNETEKNWFGEWNENDWVDLFGWGTWIGGWNPLNTSESSNDYNMYSNSIYLNGISWHTPSADEWTYLFNNHTYGKATVINVYGVIILPDGCTLSINTSNTNYDNNIISESDWTNIYETAGAVFLPAAGDRAGTSVGVGAPRGFYWSSTKDGDYYAKSVQFGRNGLNITRQNRYYGYSVRLYRTVSAEPTLPLDGDFLVRQIR